jgi:hypothetical protein
MEMLVIDNDFDIQYYKKIVDELEAMKHKVNESLIWQVASHSKTNITVEEEANLTELVCEINECMDRFFSDTEEHFHVKDIYDFEGVNRSMSYVSFSISTYSSEIIKAHDTFHIAGF